MYGLVHFCPRKMYEMVHSVNNSRMMQRSMAIAITALDLVCMSFRGK
jgi:hypothetical protein